MRQAEALPLLLELMSRHPDLKSLWDRQKYPTWREVHDAVLAQAVPDLLCTNQRDHLSANHRDWTPGDAERWLGFIATHLRNPGTCPGCCCHASHPMNNSTPSMSMARAADIVLAADVRCRALPRPATMLRQSAGRSTRDPVQTRRSVVGAVLR